MRPQKMSEADEGTNRNDKYTYVKSVKSKSLWAINDLRVYGL